MYNSAMHIRGTSRDRDILTMSRRGQAAGAPRFLLASSHHHALKRASSIPQLDALDDIIAIEIIRFSRNALQSNRSNDGGVCAVLPEACLARTTSRPGLPT